MSFIWKKKKPLCSLNSTGVLFQSLRFAKCITFAFPHWMHLSVWLESLIHSFFSLSDPVCNDCLDVINYNLPVRWEPSAYPLKHDMVKWIINVSAASPVTCTVVYYKLEAHWPAFISELPYLVRREEREEGRIEEEGGRGDSLSAVRHIPQFRERNHARFNLFYLEK